jgi:hypothetical protein
MRYLRIEAPRIRIQLVFWHAYDSGWAGKTGSGTENRNGPKGALHFRYLTPFSSE